MNIHILKEEPKYFDALVGNSKTCEIRKNDRDYKVGDILILAEWKDENYTGEIYITSIRYIDNYPDGLKDGYVVLSLNKDIGERKVFS